MDICKGKLFCLFIPPTAHAKYLIPSPSNFKFGVISPWLEKILILVPLKCLEMLPNRPDMKQYSNYLTENKEVGKNTTKKSQ